MFLGKCRQVLESKCFPLPARCAYRLTSPRTVQFAHCCQRKHALEHSNLSSCYGCANRIVTIYPRITDQHVLSYMHHHRTIHRGPQKRCCLCVHGCQASTGNGLQMYLTSFISPCSKVGGKLQVVPLWSFGCKKKMGCFKICVFCLKFVEIYLFLVKKKKVF